ATFSGTLPRGTGAYSGTVTRLNRTLFLLQATGRDASGSAQRAVSRVVRLAPPPLDLRAALTVSGSLDIGPSSLVDGEEHGPEGWACPAAVAAPGVRIRDPARIANPGCPLSSCIRGNPAVIGDSTPGDSLSQADEANWQALAALAAKVYTGGYGPAADIAPAGTATTCDSSVRGNWGDPASPPAVAGCTHYLPVVYAGGDLRLSGGSGQGILLVAGDMVVEGGFQFRGVLLVRGRLTVLGMGGRILGSVRAASVDLRPGGPAGSAEILYSSCAVWTALLQNAGARLLTPRGWVEPF
ncbi:MAG TPA: hypothetical protein PK416_12985, partial [Thermodesulfobacteriota bacterium]|nr:hypothetical protein [Thermodesulfobacteriota bacterium]